VSLGALALLVLPFLTLIYMRRRGQRGRAQQRPVAGWFASVREHVTERETKKALHTLGEERCAPKPSYHRPACVCMHVLMYVCMYVYMFVCVYVCMYV
jgi:hypothetical protein